ncbi:sugar transporter SWEET1 [Condylostylus longicornis]|uniref:sugar transporter SWEET1 n=1 Tax=Condylostylus longicornis TaxID=2530218 RepID=UPI00244E4209|nr:sugar transporter SWEET1 [Condylostylus longicornis]XP_055371292.1 sugar transporter SWEET1 [Condylostylus longicornis]
MIKSIGLSLVPYSNILAKIAGTLTSLQFLSGFFFLNDIRKKNSTIGFPVWPFLGGIVLCAISLKFGVIIRDDAMIKVNFLGFALNIVFMMVFYYFTPNENKLKLWGQIGLSGLFTAGCFAYADWENPNLVEFRLGMLITIVLVFLVGSPLLSLGDIMKKRSTEGLPFAMIFSGTLVSASWMLYGFSILNDLMVFQNAFLLFLSGIQLSLFAIYPSSANKNDNIRDKKTK